MSSHAFSAGVDDATLTVCLGDVPIALTGPVAWLDAVAHRYGAFTVEEPASFEIRYRTTRPEPADLLSPLEVRNELHTFTGDGPTVITGRSFSATIDIEAGVAEVQGPVALYPLEYVIRYALPALIDDGLLLHGAGLVDGDKAWACCGPSGCGKTTLASLLPDQAVCDELLAVRRGRGGWEFLSLPYWQGRPARATLAGLYALGHGVSDSRRKLEHAAAFRTFSGLVLWPTLFPTAMERSFEILAALVEAVPACELLFAPTPSVWETIRAEVAP